MKGTDFHIEALIDKSQAPYRLLLLADPSRDMIKEYLEKGDSYIALSNGELVGVIVLMARSLSEIEIVNVAVAEEARNKGYGKLLLRFAIKNAKKRGYKKISIGTGNSSLSQLALYQKEGFEISGLIPNHYINNYQQPLYENGIQCKHKILLEKKLK